MHVCQHFRPGLTLLVSLTGRRSLLITHSRLPKLDYRDLDNLRNRAYRATTVTISVPLPTVQGFSQAAKASLLGWKASLHGAPLTRKCYCWSTRGTQRYLAQRVSSQRHTVVSRSVTTLILAAVLTCNRPRSLKHACSHASASSRPVNVQAVSQRCL